MRRRTDILTHLLLLLLILVACTADDAIKENLSHQDEYVTVRMHIPGMKTVATRAAEADNITSIVALVFRSNQLISVTEYSKTNSALHPISPISGTITIEKPTNGDVIHFLANLPANYSDGVTYVNYLKGFINQNKTQEDVLRNLSSRDYSKLSYWGMATRNDNNAVMDVMLYRNKAMIEIKPGENCTFRQDELFIAGLDNPNNVGLLVPYNGGFNFDLDNNDYLTLPADPDPLDKTDELTNYGAGYDNAYYVFEHENPDDLAKGLYVICKIGDDYYKVALTSDGKTPYDIIRNHKYTILVNDLDAGCETYSEALSADPIKPTVIETEDVIFTYTDNAMLNLNNNDTYTVTMDPKGGTLTSLSIAVEGFTVASSIGGLTGPTNNVYTYAGGYTQFTFTPTSAGSSTIRFYDGQGENINVPEKNIIVTVNATISAEADKETIYHDGNDKTVTVRVTIPKGVSGLNISAPDFNYGDETDGSYTYNRGDATTETTVQLEFTLKDNVKEVKTSTFTFSDASGNANVSSVEVDINVEKTPVQTNVLTVTPLTSTTIDLSGSGNNTVQLRLTIPDVEGQLEISTNNIFKIEGINGCDNPTFNNGNFNYYYYNIPNNKTIEIGVTVNNDILEMVGKYMVTFNYSINNSSQSVSVSTSIDLVNNSLSTGVLWEGTQAINYSPGHSISSEILNSYKGKTMKVDVSIGNDDYSEILFKRSDKTLYQYTTNDVLKSGEDTTLEVVIPSDLDQAITIYGSGVTLKKIYFVE